MGRDRLTELNDSKNPFASTPEPDPDPAMSQFLAQSQECRSLLTKMETSVEEIKKLHKDILTVDQDGEAEGILTQKMDGIKSTASRIKDLLKSMDVEVQKAKSENQTSTHFRIMKTQHFSASNHFIDLMNSFNMAQLDYRGKCKRQIQRQIEITGKFIDDEELEDMIQSGNPKVFTQGIIMDRDEISINTVLDQQNKIFKLEKSINEMTELFNDVALLIESQGDVIDHIEHHVDATANYIKEGLVQTKKALVFQKAARRKKIICIVILLLVIAIIVVIVVVVLRKRK